MAGIYEGIRTLLLPVCSLPLSWFYDWTGSYVLAIFLLTVIIRLALLPVSIKQQKNSAKQTRLNAKVNRIRQKYANNQQKAQQQNLLKTLLTLCLQQFLLLKITFLQFQKAVTRLHFQV